VISRRVLRATQKRAKEYLDKAGIVLTSQEVENMEVADFGLGDLEHLGLEVVVYVNTERVCAKEIVMFPRQVCPEHRHPTVRGKPGKEETFRCRWGEVYLYIPGEPAPKPRGIAAPGRQQYFTVWHEIILKPSEQYTLMPDTLHWFQAGDSGAIVSEFSTRSTDEQDLFTDPEIRRIPVVE
jgi:D-lyxose ketol-isomerase